MNSFASRTIAGLCTAILLVVWPSASEDSGSVFRLDSIQVDTGSSDPSIHVGINGSPVYRVTYEAGLKIVHLDLANTAVSEDFNSMVIDGSGAIQDVQANTLQTGPQTITRVDFVFTQPTALNVLNATGSKFSLKPLNSQEEISAFTKGMKNLRLEQERAMAKSYMQAVSLVTDAKMKRLATGNSALLEKADAALSSARNNVLALELARMDNASKQRAADVEKANAVIQKNKVVTRSMAARAQHEIAAASANVDAAQITEISSIVSRFENAQKASIELLASLSTELEEHVERAQMLAASLTQIHVAAQSQTPARQRAGLAELDRELNEVRMASSTQPKLQTPPAQHQVAAVAPEDTLHPVAKAQALAAMTSTDVDTGNVAPPTKRTRPVGKSYSSISVVESPDKMAVLRATDKELGTAELEGRIRLAQVEGGTGIKEIRAPERRAPQNSAAPRRFVVPRKSGIRPDFAMYNPNVPAEEDPLQQLVDIDFKDMDMTNVVGLLARQAQINVIMGTEVEGKVTAELKGVPLGRAFEIVLRLNGYGIVEEAGVYRITTYAEAAESRRETSMVFLRNAQAEEIKQSLDDIISTGAQQNLLSVSSNASTNVIIISGPRERVQELETVVAELDVAEQVIPTVTVPIKLNYTDPEEMLPVVTALLSENGTASPDIRGRHIVVTDIPIKVEEIEAVVETIDIAVKQVHIESMVVDALMSDEAETGVDWLLNSRHTQTPTAIPSTPTTVPELAFATATGSTDLAGALTWGLVSDDIELTATIAAQVRNQNAELLANPTILTVENKPATINITTEFPFQERTQTEGGGQLSSTEFKEIGTILTVTPFVTHENDIVAELDIKESTIVGLTETGVPIEAKRVATTTLRVNDGHTIYVGGLRSTNDQLSETKVPFLGDVPGLNVFFKSTVKEVQNIELLVFLTCNVIPMDYAELTPYEKTRFDKLGGTPMKPEGERDLVDAYIHPEHSRDPFYKWRRAK